MMPFITEELWENLTDGQVEKWGGMLIKAEWPKPDASWRAPDAAAEMDWVVKLIESVRAVRSEMNVPAAAKIALTVKDASAEATRRIESHRSLILTLARLESITPQTGDVPKGAVQIVVEEATLILPLAGVIDIGQERSRLQKEIGRVEGEIRKVAGKLGNEAFVAKAPPEVVEENRERLAEFEAAKAKLSDALKRISAV
jgi:valyl-tRNA synthetase